MTAPFNFYTQAHLVRLLGTKAKNAAELTEGIRKVPTSSIYYHTHHFLRQHNYLSPEPTNDFAYWVSNILGRRELGEALASVDIITFKDLEDLRSEFIRKLEKYNGRNGPVSEVPEGHEFHFMSCITVVTPTHCHAASVPEFVDCLKNISVNSLYYHVFEARMRLTNGANDFAIWLRSNGLEKAALNISRLDPYTMTLEGLRERIIEIVGKYV
ncbi:conserved hypothetical protein [Candidatus Zixiibacteriota bacterium]|nr:conserved hypothetical protein [candidate division Zixibacteria bacterium]